MKGRKYCPLTRPKFMGFLPDIGFIFSHAQSFLVGEIINLKTKETPCFVIDELI